ERLRRDVVGADSDAVGRDARRAGEQTVGECGAYRRSLYVPVLRAAEKGEGRLETVCTAPAVQIQLLDDPLEDVRLGVQVRVDETREYDPGRAVDALGSRVRAPQLARIAQRGDATVVYRDAAVAHRPRVIGSDDERVFQQGCRAI